MTEKQRAYAYLHICVFIWGFTAILGKLISLNTLPLVWWRVFLCSATLWIVIPKAQFRGLTPRKFWELFGIGVLVGIHWLAFYGAIKIANASVAVASMATITVFAALVEPVMLKQRVKLYELALGLFVLPGMALVVGNVDWHMRLGFGVGIFGAFLAAVFTALNKKVLNSDPPPPLAISFVELFAALVVTSLALPVVWANHPDIQLLPLGWDWMWLFLLAWACTLLPYYLTLQAMRHLSAFITNLTINLEPVYGVILAALVFREDKDLNPRFYIGVFIILVAVFSHPLLKKMVEKQESAGSTTI